ncbi:MAG: hypothetical protein C5B51_21240 [Terriglobia bacterium]|nr:MAG: hypothetical protein C5B51_21240 [Terriglobia bacterium]
MMRFILSGLLLTLLSSSATRPGYPQNTAQAGNTQAKDQFFTGIVTAVDDQSLTVNRMVLGKNSSTKTFAVTAETRFEGGRPTVRSQVTVRYVTTDDGDRAVNVILRRSPK